MKLGLVTALLQISASSFKLLQGQTGCRDWSDKRASLWSQLLPLRCIALVDLLSTIFVFLHCFLGPV